jgi:hypothetical protein
MNGPDKPPTGRGRTPAFELELTKGPDGKLRHFRFTVGAVAVGLLLFSLCVLMPEFSGHRLDLLRWIVTLR